MGFFLWLELREMYLPLTLTHPWGTGGDAEKSCDRSKGIEQLDGLKKKKKTTRPIYTLPIGYSFQF